MLTVRILISVVDTCFASDLVEKAYPRDSGKLSKCSHCLETGSYRLIQAGLDIIL